MTHEFWLDDISCTDYGIMVQKFPPISRAKERVSTVTIPGRSGTLTLLQGDDVYDAVTKTVTCAVADGTDIEALTSWLCGDHLLRLGNEPDYCYEARVANQADLQHMFNNGWQHQVNIPFYCQPLKRQYPQETDITLTAAQIYNTDATVNNPGTVTVKPTMAVTIKADAQTETPEGSPEAYVPDITLTVYRPSVAQGNAVILTKMKPGDVVVLDWQMGDAYYYTTRTNANNHVIGNPQRMAPGDNRVRVDSEAVQSIVIKPHWRWA